MICSAGALPAPELCNETMQRPKVNETAQPSGLGTSIMPDGHCSSTSCAMIVCVLVCVHAQACMPVLGGGAGGGAPGCCMVAAVQRPLCSCPRCVPDAKSKA